MVKVQVPLVLLASTLVAAAAPVRQQCGGLDWKGSTDCIEGERCVMVTYAYFECQRETAIAAAPPPIFLTSFTRITPRPSYTPRVEERDEEVPISSAIPPGPPLPFPPGPKPPVSGTRPPISVPTFSVTRSTAKPPPYPTRPPIPVPTWSVTRSTVKPTYITRPPISIPTWPVTRSTVLPSYSTRPPLPVPTWSVTRGAAGPTIIPPPPFPFPTLSITRTRVNPTSITRAVAEDVDAEGITLISLTRTTSKPTYTTRFTPRDEPERPADIPTLTIPAPGPPGPAPPIPSTILITSLTRTTANSVPTPRTD